MRDIEQDPRNIPSGLEPTATAESDASQLRSCFHLLGQVEDQLRFADSKAGFLATLHAFLVSPLIYNVAEVRKAFRQWDPASLAVLVAFGSVYAVLFLVAMGL